VSANSPSKQIDSYIARIRMALDGLDLDAVREAAELLESARQRNALVLVAGNGGSASTASHMATDLGVGSHKQGVGLRTICLTDNSSVLTATANDISFERIFAEQIELLAGPGDVVILSSASGDSPNIIEAYQSAVSTGATVIALTGFEGGRLRDLAAHCIHIPTSSGDYGPVEDVHLIANHMLTELLRQAASPAAGDLA
jgi:D-sedoheptulose 7-phosphate isomerase